LIILEEDIQIGERSGFPLDPWLVPKKKLKGEPDIGVGIKEQPYFDGWGPQLWYSFYYEGPALPLFREVSRHCFDKRGYKSCTP